MRGVRYHVAGPAARSHLRDLDRDAAPGDAARVSDRTEPETREPERDHGEPPESEAIGARSRLVPPPPASGPWRSYKEIVAQLAQRVLDAQRPMRILQALRWDPGVEEQFLKAKKELPKVTYEP